MISIVVILALIGQAPADAEPSRPVAGRPILGSVQVLARADGGEIRLGQDRLAVAELASSLTEPMRGDPDRGFTVTGPVRVRLLALERIAGSEPPREVCQVDILEGPVRGKVGWTFRSYLIVAAVSERPKARAQAKAVSKPASASTAQEQARALVEKRRQRKAARHRASQAREAAEISQQGRSPAMARSAYPPILPFPLGPPGPMWLPQPANPFGNPGADAFAARALPVGPSMGIPAGASGP